MKKSEFKEYLKTEILKMNEATAEEVDMQKELNAELEKTKELTSQMEGKVKKSEFKEYLRNEILAEIAEQEEEEVDVEAEEEVDAETFDFDEPSFGEEEGGIDAITDALVKLAKDAKEAGQTELANQILNSAKFSAKTEFKKVEKEA
jgi:hypothetical protein